MYIHVYTSDFDYVSSDVYILYIFIKLHVYNYVCTYVRMYACMCMCVCAYLRIIHMYDLTYAYEII